MVELQQRFAVCHTQPWSFISSRAHETHVPVKCEALKKHYGTIRVHVHESMMPVLVDLQIAKMRLFFDCLSFLGV